MSVLETVTVDNVTYDMHDPKVGSGTLQTTAQTLIPAVNELKTPVDKIGSGSLNTTSQTLIGAINEVNNLIAGPKINTFTFTLKGDDPDYTVFTISPEADTLIFIRWIRPGTPGTSDYTNYRKWRITASAAGGFKAGILVSAYGQTDRTKVPSELNTVVGWGKGSPSDTYLQFDYSNEEAGILFLKGGITYSFISLRYTNGQQTAGAEVSYAILL